MTDEVILKGSDYIKAFAKALGNGPGVYRMIGEDDKVLYVGKAKNLKNRVTTYATKGALSTRILRMVSQTCKMEVITTRSEAEALLLEASLIKQLNPLYNILLRDDKSFPSIMLSDHPYPQIKKHRGAQKKGATYFGPFASAGAVNQTLSILQRAFLLRPCEDTVFKNRSRPCLQYQIKRCSAPCVELISESDYNDLIEEAKSFLSGKSRDIQEKLQQKMAAHSEAMEFEQAALCRDRIKVLTQVQGQQGIHLSGVQDADFIGIYTEEGKACVEVFFYRGGQPFGNRAYFPTIGGDQEEQAILSGFIGQLYQTQHPPKQVFISHDLSDRNLLEEAFALYSGHEVRISHPQRGDKKQFMEQVVANARHALGMRQAERMHEQKHLKAIQKLFDLPEQPTRLEVYDNSHISGSHAVGAMVVAGTEGLMKNQYRRFTIRNTELEPGDDYAMMREVLTRRLSRLQKEDADRKEGMWPDLLIIDGGKGQLSAVLEITEELGITDLPVVAIAKGPDRNAGREQFFMPDRAPFQLPINDPTLHYLQRLRDEAHRFAISSHRIKRSNAIKPPSWIRLKASARAEKRHYCIILARRRAWKPPLWKNYRMSPVSAKKSRNKYMTFFMAKNAYKSAT